MQIPFFTGLGIDIVNVLRIKRLFDLRGRERVLKKLFTNKEICDLDSRFKHISDDYIYHVAGRIACKEAVFKSVSSICKPNWKDMSIVQVENLDGNLKPYLSVCSEIIKAKKISVCLSVSHDGEYAVASSVAFQS